MIAQIASNYLLPLNSMLKLGVSDAPEIEIFCMQIQSGSNEPKMRPYLVLQNSMFQKQVRQAHPVARRNAYHAHLNFHYVKIEIYSTLSNFCHISRSIAQFLEHDDFAKKFQIPSESDLMKMIEFASINLPADKIMHESKLI